MVKRVVLFLTLSLVFSELSAQEDFPIEKYYPDVKITVNSDGQPQFSKSSKAFILWRNRTSPYEFPPSAFAFHYLTNEQIVELSISVTEAASRVIRESQLTEVREYSLPKEIQPEKTLIDAKAGVLADVIEGDLADRLREKNLTKLYKAPNNYHLGFGFNIILYEYKGERKFLAAPKELIGHEGLMNSFRINNPEMPILFLSAIWMDFKFSLDFKSILSIDVARESPQAIVYEGTETEQLRVIEEAFDAVLDFFEIDRESGTIKKRGKSDNLEWIPDSRKAQSPCRRLLKTSLSKN